MKAGADPLHRDPLADARKAPRCAARSKRTGKPCRNPAVRSWRVCRMHGARGGGPSGRRNGAYRHGLRTKDAAAERSEMMTLIEAVKRTMKEI